MIKNKQSFNWILDAGLLVGFLAEFFLNLTGVELHQWLGMGLGIFAGYHLLAHWNWVKSVTAKFFGKVGTRVRDYYLVDAGLLTGFLLILATGLVISTWINLSLGSYVFWKDFHVTVSIATLLLVVLKVGLHWRWVVSTAQRMFGKLPQAGERTPSPSGLPARGALAPLSQPVRAPVVLSAPRPAALTRRHFIALIGMVGMSAWMAVSNTLLAEKEVQAEALPGDAPTGQTAAAAGAASSSAGSTGTTAATAIPAATAKSAATATPAAASSSSGALSGGSCRVQCSKRCSYPGKCRKYVDRNNNKKCDLGECA